MDNLTLYALHDSDIWLRTKGAFKIDRSKAHILNDHGYGIFHTPNEFKGQRKKENLIKINYWIADIDGGDKSRQRELISELPFLPTTIIETKNGYHCYFKAKDATDKNYETIENGIIEKLNADKGCKDIARMLRAPGFNHMKDKSNPFMVDIVYSSKDEFSEKEMLAVFRVKKVHYRSEFRKHTGEQEMLANPKNWDRLFGLSRIGKGCRNNTLARITFWLRDAGFPGHEVASIIHDINAQIDSLSEREVNSILRGKI